MSPKILQSIYLKYLPRYTSEVKSFQPDRLRSLIKKAAKDARENYKKLSQPKACSIGLYTEIWVGQEVRKDLAVKTLKKISVDNPPPEFKAQINYFAIMPHERHGELRKKLYDSPINKRGDIWDSFKLPLDEIEKRFIQMTISRNEFAKRKGYRSYIDILLDSHKIPQSDYKKLIEKSDKLIGYCNSQLPKIGKLPTWFYSKFNIPCFMCQLPVFPFKTLDETFSYCAKKHNVLDKFKYKIKVKLDDDSRMLYRKETDSFEIAINKNNNIRHQSIELIHELAHVINYLRDFKKEIDPLVGGARLHEKEALAVELSILKELSPELFYTHFTDALLTIRRTLFEIELYTNPKQNLSKLYAETLNRCFKKANQKENPTYLLDERIVLRPLSTLPHAVAYATYLDKKI
ncbi:MAG: hypothetical protein HYU80_02480 [Candidatus Blackburnbacteria bacterium]|nr:hypothetical protein [Candidatus Blackburnbacteria bacterium]